MHIMTNLLDKILDRQNMYQAIKRVYSNKGAAGVDGITIDKIDEYIRENWQEIKSQIKTCVTRAISKDILTRRGLVSLLDYYEHRCNVRFN